MPQLQYKGHTFKSLSAFIEWAKLNGICVISERDRQVTIINPTPPKPATFFSNLQRCQLQPTQVQQSQ